MWQNNVNYDEMKSKPKQQQQNEGEENEENDDDERKNKIYLLFGDNDISLK